MGHNPVVITMLLDDIAMSGKRNPDKHHWFFSSFSNQPVLKNLTCFFSIDPYTQLFSWIPVAFSHGISVPPLDRFKGNFAGEPTWWLTYPSEKYGSMGLELSHLYIYILWKNNPNVPNHQPEPWSPVDFPWNQSMKLGKIEGEALPCHLWYDFPVVCRGGLSPRCVP